MRHAGGGHPRPRVRRTRWWKAAPVCSPTTREDLTAGLDTVLSDADAARAPRYDARAEHAARYTWEATARGTLEVLAQAAIRRRTHP